MSADETTRERIERFLTYRAEPKRKALAFVRKRPDIKQAYAGMLADGVIYETGSGRRGDPIMTHLAELDPAPKPVTQPKLLSDFWPGFVLDIDGGLWGLFIWHAERRGLEPGQQLQALLQAYIDGLTV